MILEDECGLLSAADRKLFFRVVELDERIATLPDSWAISTIMTRVREMKKVDNGQHDPFYKLEDGETAPEDKPAEGSLAALQEWLRAADDDTIRRSSALIDAETTRRIKMHSDALGGWGISTYYEPKAKADK